MNKKWYLNLKNGLFDMETFKLLPHTPSYFSTVQVQYEYNPKARSPEFNKFIDTISGHSESTAIMIKQMYGYSLMEGNPRHKVFYLYGDTARNGKSTCAKILCGLIGWGNVSTLTLQQIGSENSSILTSIIGKQINFSDEISSKFIESSRLTAMAAEGVVEINPKYKPSFLYSVKTKFIIACNDLPRFSDYQGMKHRMISIPFRYHLKESERIDRYDEILLEKEGAGILNWAIEGAKNIKNGIFEINDDSKEDIQDNILQSYPVYAFLENLYDFSLDFTDEIDPKDLYGEHATESRQATGFRLYCDELGIKTLSFPIFTRELKRFSRETENIKQIRVGHRQDRRYIGMKLKTEIDDEKEFNKIIL
jgi:P4 family phage/plasmid primase-like protien